MTMVGTWFGGFELLISENQTKMRFDFWNWLQLSVELEPESEFTYLENLELELKSNFFF
jgi:hypothetical protein